MDTNAALLLSSDTMRIVSLRNTQSIRRVIDGRTLQVVLHGPYIDHWAQQRGDFFQFLIDEIIESYLCKGLVMNVCPDDMIVILYDETRQVFLAGRDRLGMLPLYWTGDRQVIHVSTSARALVEQGLASRTITPQNLDDFLVLQYIPGEETLWRDVHKVPPAHELRWERGHAIQKHRYWSLRFGQGKLCSPEERKEELQFLLEERFRDLPPADGRQELAMISGGIDTSTNIHFLTQYGRQPTGLTVVFEEEGYSEGEFAELVAAHYDLPHVLVTHKAADLALLPEMLSKFDEPNGDQAALASYAGLRHLNGYSCLYSGEGGDELFGLPRRYPVECLREAATDLDKLADRYVKLLQYLPRKMRTFVYNSSVRSVIDTEHTVRYFRRLFGEVESHSVLPRLIYAQLNTWLAENVVAKDRQVAGAIGVDARFPLLSHKLISFIALIPESELFDMLHNKALVRQVLQGRLPEAILTKQKHTFLVPMKEWFDQPAVLSGQFQPLLRADHPIWNLLERNRVAELVDLHQSGKQNVSLPLWQILAFATWLQVSPVDFDW
jgi:asparagine synthase (glutamine-hydrolysing)